MSHNQVYLSGSPLRSVRIMGGDFYNLGWNVIFTPLTPAEHQLFLAKVAAAEARQRRVLSSQELEKIALEVQHGSSA